MPEVCAITPAFYQFKFFLVDYIATDEPNTPGPDH